MKAAEIFEENSYPYTFEKINQNENPNFLVCSLFWKHTPGDFYVEGKRFQ